MTGPPDRTRKSIALYYYTNGRPEELGPVVEHNTRFSPQPGDPFSPRKALTRAAGSNRRCDLIPPVPYRRLRAAHNRRHRKATA